MNIDELLAALNALRVTVAEAMERIDAMASALEAQKVTPQTLADAHVSIPPTEADSPANVTGESTLKMAIDLLDDYVRVLNDQTLVSRPAEDALRGEKHPAAPPIIIIKGLADRIRSAGERMHNETGDVVAPEVMRKIAAWMENPDTDLFDEMMRLWAEG